jgi:hypothetical protein
MANKMYVVYRGKGKLRKNLHIVFSTFSYVQAMMYISNIQNALGKSERAWCEVSDTWERVWDSEHQRVRDEFGRFSIEAVA